MRLESKKYLFDVKQAADLLAEFTQAKSFEDFQSGDCKGVRNLFLVAVDRKYNGVGDK
jgi:hypothetical protein